MRNLNLMVRRSALVLVTLCLISCLVRPAPVWAGATIAQDVVSGGGGEAQSASYSIHDTFGQDPLGPVATGTTINLHDGFWGSVGMGEAVPADTVPPSPVASFTAMPLDTSVGLEWTNPSDADFSGTLIRYSTSTYPATPTDGSVVDNGQAGRFYNEAGSADSYTHGGLTNGTTYYYTAFAFDSANNYATGLSDSATPYDGVPPAAVVSLTADVGDGSLTLRWTNPADADLDSTLIRYSMATYPTGPGDGTAVENGSDGKFPAAVDTFVHVGLTNGTTYYYSAFAGDEVPNYAVATQASAIPSDIWPPLPVSVFTATALADGSVELEWATPDDSDFVGALIRYSTSTYPSSPTSGTAVENAASGMFPGDPMTPYDFNHTGLLNGITHYYSIFAYDEVPNYSSPNNDVAVPDDQVPPDLSISVLQNPYITNHLDIYVVGSETLIDTSLHCEVWSIIPEVLTGTAAESGSATNTLEMELVDADENVWMGDYDLCCTGAIEIHAQARDVNLNWAKDEHAFSSALILASGGGIALSVDGLCDVGVRGGVISQDTYVLIFESEANVLLTGKIYEISPTGLDLDDFVEIAIAYPDTVSSAQHLAIARLDEKGPAPVESYLDHETGRVIAYVERLGAYGLIHRPDVVTPTYGTGELAVLQNIPNPFESTTLISFEVPRAGQVHADVISIDGRLVCDLMDTYVIPGRHSVEWDGCDTAGRRVASGVYFYRVGYGSKTITRKMVHVR